MEKKNIWKKAASLVLAFSMLASVTACGSAKSESSSSGSASAKADEKKYFDDNGQMILPLVDEPTTFKVLWRKWSDDKGTINDKGILAKAFKDTGISWDVEEVPDSGWDEKISVLFASGDLPDLICGQINGLVNYTDQCTDVTDLLTKYAPFMDDFLNKQYPAAAKAEAFGGKLYSLPQLRINGLYPSLGLWNINTTWLKNVGMEIPKTTDELYQVLKAFKEKDANGDGDPNDEIPYSFVGLLNADGLLNMMNCFGMVNDGASTQQQYVMVEDGKVLFAPSDKRFYDMLVYLNKLYSEGLIDADSFVQEGTDRYAKGTADRIGFFTAGGLGTGTVGDEVGAQFEYMLPPASEYGAAIKENDPPAEMTTHCYTITKACKNPELLILFQEYCNSSSDNRFLGRFGPEGGAWVYDENQKAINATDFTGKPYVNRAQATATLATQSKMAGIITAEDEARRGYAGFSIPYNDAVLNIYGPKGGCAYDECFPLGNDTAENSVARTEMFTEIDTYIQNFVAESVMTGIDESKWNTHLKSCEKLNVKDYVEGFQSLYDSLK